MMPTEGRRRRWPILALIVLSIVYIRTNAFVFPFWSQRVRGGNSIPAIKSHKPLLYVHKPRFSVGALALTGVNSHTSSREPERTQPFPTILDNAGSPSSTISTSQSVPSTTTRPTSIPTSFPPPVHPTTPLKVMIFIDGTWLYYSTYRRARNFANPFVLKFGDDWQRNYKLDWRKLPQVLCTNLNQQLQVAYNYNRAVEIVRTTVFTSAREDTDEKDTRIQMINDMTSVNFEMVRFVTVDRNEKCVDIALAVEMLYMATVPDAYDIAVIITGDKDFIPAIQKTRLKAKRVAICSVRNSCNRDLVRPENHVRDFDMIWLDDYLDDIVVLKDTIDDETGNAIDASIVKLILGCIEQSPIPRISSRELGKYLQAITIKDENGMKVSALLDIKKRYGNLRTFLESQPSDIALFFPQELVPDYYVTNAADVAALYEAEARKNDGDEDDDDDDDEEEDVEGEEGGEEEEDDEAGEDVPLEDGEEDAIMERIQDMTVPHLKLLLKEAGLSSAGKKLELTERLFQYELDKLRTERNNKARLDRQGDGIEGTSQSSGKTKTKSNANANANANNNNKNNINNNINSNGNKLHLSMLTSGSIGYPNDRWSSKEEQVAYLLQKEADMAVNGNAQKRKPILTLGSNGVTFSASSQHDGMYNDDDNLNKDYDIYESQSQSQSQSSSSSFTSSSSSSPSSSSPNRLTDPNALGSCKSILNSFTKDPTWPTTTEINDETLLQLTKCFLQNVKASADPRGKDKDTVVASSRELGRFLAATFIPLGKHPNGGITALAQIKLKHRSLKNFIDMFPDVFLVDKYGGPEERDKLEFFIRCH